MGQITEDEYSRWYSPHAAVEALRVAGYDPQTLYSTILFRVTMDELRTVAEKRITTAKYHNEKTTRLGLLAPGMWEVAGITPSFWDSGDVIFRKQHQASEPTFTYACTGIRFDPAGIEKLVAQKRPPAPDTRTAYNKAGDAVTAALQRLHDLLPPADERPDEPSTSANGSVTTAQVDAWYTTLTSEDRARSVRWLHREAQRDLGLGVVRKQVEHFGKDRKPGRKAKA